MTDNLRYYVALNGGMKVMEGRSGSFEEIGEFFHGRTLEHLIGCRNKPEVVFAAVAFDGGFRTRDGGKSWEKIMEGDVRTFTVDPHDERVVYMKLAGMSLVLEVDRVIAAETGIAKALLLAVEVRIHPFPTEIGEGVGVDEAADLFY